MAKTITQLGLCTWWAKKPELFLRVDNFATVNGEKVCDMLRCSDRGKI